MFISHLRADIYALLVSEATIVSDNNPEDGQDNARASLQTRKILLHMQHAICAPERANFPVIAALHGHVIGLGVDLIGACDIRYAASDTSFIIKVCRLWTRSFFVYDLI